MKHKNADWEERVAAAAKGSAEFAKDKNDVWKEQQRLLGAAKALAEFANLRSSGVKVFKAKHPDFFPGAWWSYRSIMRDTPQSQWKMVQNLVRDAWLYRFQVPPFHSMWLMSSVFDPKGMDWSKTKRPPFVTDLDVLDIELYPYHEAIQWLQGQGWRAKICLYCKKCFIGEHPRRQFCNFGTTVKSIEVSCFWAHRKKYQKRQWAEHGTEYRLNAGRSQEAATDVPKIEGAEE